MSSYPTAEIALRLLIRRSESLFSSGSSSPEECFCSRAVSHAIANRDSGILDTQIFSTKMAVLHPRPPGYARGPEQ